MTKFGELKVVYYSTCGIAKYQQKGTRELKPKGSARATVGKPFIEVCASFFPERGKNCTATPSQICII